ncbi:DUF6458 family protein [Streptomyces sp. S5]|uniref:DUF6458 family protein n=1 Tax=Streptomyces sp. S5 TaxID=1456735 RepID=UPI000ADC2FCE|nr:DUF6458 family protein [Streptomyces sp. S5]
MGLGGCIILIAVGAILTFATDFELEGINVTLVGAILMLVGVIGTIAFTSIARRRRLLMTQTPPVVEGSRTHDDRLI